MGREAVSSGVGTMLRDWRGRRRLSQLDLALDAGVSARHISFLETGRSSPSRRMIVHLAEALDLPLRDRNGLLHAAGFAPAYEHRPLEDPEMAPVSEAIQRLLAAHDPYPALVVDGAWEMLAGNAAIGHLIDGVDEGLLAPPVNVLRLSLHPDGLALRIVNLRQWRAHLLDRLRRQIALTENEALRTLLAEIEAYPAAAEGADAAEASSEIAVPLRIRAGDDRAVPDQHDFHVRHRGRGDDERAVDRVLLPRRRRHC